MATSPDYPILGPPRISFDGFAAVLRDNRSPSAGEAAACYRAFTSYGVDPAVGLAVFRKESTFGRFGRATRNRSWGNIRGSSAGYPLDSGGFRIYPTWTAGAQDCAQLLARYGTNRIRLGTNTSTVQTMPFVWAPASDGNAPDRYGDQLVAWITDWSRRYPAAGSSAPPLPGATPINDPGSDGGTRTMAEYLGVPPSAIFDAAMLTRFLAKVYDDYGPAGNYAQGYLRDTYARHLGKPAGEVPWVTTADGSPAPLFGEDPLGSVVAGLRDVLTNAVVLIVILVLIVIALYRLTSS